MDEDAAYDPTEAPRSSSGLRSALMGYEPGPSFDASFLKYDGALAGHVGVRSLVPWRVLIE